MIQKNKEKFNNYIVGIGASAGGLEAIETFFSNMPADTGLTFIVIQHLSPDYKSLMVELLSKKTRMPVYRAEDGMAVEPDSIYLIPPKKNLTIFHSKLLLHEQDRYQGINLPIDVFLRSLADDQRDKAIAIILSGTGSDGMRGSRAVKEAGGMIMAQSRESARFDGMPHAIISTGLTDFILPPEEMAEQLIAFVNYPRAPRSDHSGSIINDEDGLAKIFSLLRDKHKVDFTYYKPSTLDRRIERRMTINQIQDIKEYVRLLTNYPSEITQLYREILIGVTSFFRDQEAFELLQEKYLPELFKNSKNGQMRFWIAGCSTGEEAYSLAILARECMDLMRLNIDLKIFATDIDNDAIVTAGAGVYPESIVADIDPRLREKYFSLRENSLHISRSIREMVVFAKHNLISDPPFTNIDLVSCRNLLIYLQPILQKRALEMFNFALNPGALLFLGSSESIGDMTDYFDPLHNKWKFFRSKGRRRATDIHRIRPFNKVPPPNYGGQSNRKHLEYHAEERMQQRLLLTLAEDYVPLSFVVNEEFELQHVLGDASGYICVPQGKMLNDIKAMIVSDLTIPLTTGVQKALKKKEGLKYTNIRVTKIGTREPVNVTMRIRPLLEKRGQEPLAAIFIEEVHPVKPSENGSLPESTAQTYDIDEEVQQRIDDLERELQFTRENLQATVEELETSNEELQATNEELLASNEELQSTNEELQSVNEELFTVNAEHQQKIIELTELNTDMENLLESTELATLFLDEQLCIRKFTPQIKQFFNILDSDTNRPISHIGTNLNDIDIIPIIREVLLDSKPLNIEFSNDDGQSWFMMKIVPYHVTPEIASGVVIIFIDTTEIHNSALKRAWSNKVAEHSEDAIYLVNDKAVIESWSHGAELIYGIAEEDAIGKNIDIVLHDQAGKDFIAQLNAAADTHESFSQETLRRTKDGRLLHIWTKAALIVSVQLENKTWAVIERSLEERKSYEKELLHARDMWECTFDALPDSIAILDLNYNIVNINKAMADNLQLPKQDCIGKKCYDVVHKSACPPDNCPHAALLESEQFHQATVEEPNLGGTVEVIVSPLRDKNGICGSVHIARKPVGKE